MKDLMLIMPEIFLAITLAFVVIGEVTYHGEKLRLISGTALVGLAAAFIQSLISYQAGPTHVFANTMTVDGLSYFFRLLFILLAAIAVMMSVQTREISNEKRAEYASLILASVLGMCIAASAADILLAFLSLQFINIVGYFLAGYGKRSRLSNEAALKYMIFSSVAAALFMYGLAILFASSHVLNIYEIHKALVATPLSHNAGLVIFVFIFLALGFQMGAFPMHLWTPDVLEGAPTPVSAFLSMGGRATGFAVALRFLTAVFAQPAENTGQWEVLGHLDWTGILSMVSGLTMAIGGFLAFRQEGAKRLVGCLVIVETGQLMMGLLVLDQVGVSALLYSLAIELFALTGCYYILSFIVDELGSDRLQDLKGLLGRAVPESICLILFLSCLVGLPPMPSFFGKFALIGAALRHHRTALAVVAIASMAMSTVAIARLAFSLVGDFGISESQTKVRADFPRRIFLFTLAFPMVLASVFAESLLAWTVRSLGYILW